MKRQSAGFFIKDDIVPKCFRGTSAVAAHRDDSLYNRSVGIQRLMEGHVNTLYSSPTNRKTAVRPTIYSFLFFFVFRFFLLKILVHKRQREREIEGERDSFSRSMPKITKERIILAQTDFSWKAKNSLQSIQSDSRLRLTKTV